MRFQQLKQDEANTITKKSQILVSVMEIAVPSGINYEKMVLVLSNIHQHLK